jgi:hypothetical protein
MLLCDIASLRRLSITYLFVIPASQFAWKLHEAPLSKADYTIALGLGSLEGHDLNLPDFLTLPVAVANQHLRLKQWRSYDRNG